MTRRIIVRGLGAGPTGATGATGATGPSGGPFPDLTGIPAGQVPHTLGAGAVEFIDLSTTIATETASKADASTVYTKTQSDAAYRNPGTRVAFLGDSITSNGQFTINQTSGKGYAPQSLAYAGGVLRNVPYSASQLYFAVSGYTTAQLISNGYHTAAAASDADIVVVHAGTNSLATAPATVLAELQTIWNTILAAGKRVVATTLIPRGSTGSAVMANLNTLNDLIRAYVPTTPGMVLCDWYNVLLDPATGYMSTAYSPDDLHPNIPGAARLGAHLGPILASMVPARGPHVIPTKTARGITPNPFALGDVAGLATGWAKTNQGTPTSVTVSKVARTDGVIGEWQQAVVVAANANTDGVLLYDRKDVPVFVAGDVLRPVCEVEVDAAGLDARLLTLSCWSSAGSIGFGALWNNVPGTPTGKIPAGRSIIVGPPVTMTATPGAGSYATVGLLFMGSGTVRVSGLQLVKVN